MGPLSSRKPAKNTSSNNHGKNDKKTLNQSCRHLKKNLTNLSSPICQCHLFQSQNNQEKENTGDLKSGVSQSQVPLAPKTTIKILIPKKYYPPACSAYDMVYADGKIFVYGGIPCNTELSEGLKQHFYEYDTAVVKDINSNISHGGVKK